MNRLQNKIALITGGTTGIGAATAQMFQAEGATVIVTGSNPKTLDAARAEMPGIEVMVCDAGDVAATKALIDAVKEKHGRIDVLFVNAGIAAFSRHLKRWTKRFSTGSSTSTSKARFSP